MTTCDVENCDKEARQYRKYCSMHEGRIRRYNSPDTPRIKTVEERFWEKVDKKSDDECWEWKARRFPNGYGDFYDGEKKIKAHRYSWELHNKQKIPNGLFVCHSCDNPPCVNPAHLFLGTNQDNQIDSREKGRNNVMRGEDQPTHKLNDEDIKKIRELYATGKYTYFGLSNMFGVVFQHIARIVNKERWSHI